MQEQALARLAGSLALLLHKPTPITVQPQGRGVGGLDVDVRVPRARGGGHRQRAAHQRAGHAAPPRARRDADVGDVGAMDGVGGPPADQRLGGQPAAQADVQAPNDQLLLPSKLVFRRRKGAEVSELEVRRAPHAKCARPMCPFTDICPSPPDSYLAGELHGPIRQLIK